MGKKMRQLTLEQALKEDNVIFKVTPEQATKAASILSSDGFKHAAAIVCNSPYSGRPAYWQSEEDFEELIKSDYEAYEEIKLVATQETLKEMVTAKRMYKVGDKLRVITHEWDNVAWCKYGSEVSLNVVDTQDEEVPYAIFPKGSEETIPAFGLWVAADDVELWTVFQTQQEIWAYLSATEEHKVIHINECAIMGFKDGKLYDYKETDELWRFDEPSFWKPYNEPVKKEWWEQVPEGKPVLCWYGDNLFEDDKPKLLGLITCNGAGFYTSGGFSWAYAIPATLSEVKQYLLENILDENNN